MLRHVKTYVKLSPWFTTHALNCIEMSRAIMGKKHVQVYCETCWDSCNFKWQHKMFHNESFLCLPL